MNDKKRLLKIVLPVGFLTILIASLASATAFVYFKDKNKENTQIDQQAVLRKILQNNSQTTLAPKNEISNISGDAANEKMAANLGASDLSYSTSMIYPMIERDYTYSETQTEVKAGAAKERCSIYQFLSEGKFVSTEFFKDNVSSYEYAYYDNDGDLLDYSLTTNDGYSYYFKNGDYAVRIKNDASILPYTKEVTEDQALPIDGIGDGEIVDDGTELEPSINDFFGADAKVENATLNGKDYYKVIWSYETDCSQPMYDILTTRIYNPNDSEIKSIDQHVIWTEAYVEKDSFFIVEQREFLDDINNNNLISSTKTSMTKTNQEFTEVSSQFSFDFGVEVKEIVYPQYDPQKEAEKVYNYVTKNNIPLLRPLNEAFKMSYSYSNKAILEPENNGIDFYSDRNFYPDNSKGQKMYDDTTKLYQTSVDTNYVQANLETSFTLDSVQYPTSITIGVYDSIEENGKIANSLKYFGTTNEELPTPTSTQTFDWNGKTITREIYKAEMNSINVDTSDGKEALIAPDSYVSETEGYVVIFDYDNNTKIAISIEIKIGESIDSHINLTNFAPEVYKSELLKVYGL